MKKYVALFIMIIMIMTTMSYGFDQMDIFVPELIPTDNGNDVDEELYGASNGYEVLFNSVFRDINNATYEKEIVKLAAEGIIEKYGSFDFNPEKNITGYEALTFLVRFLGNEAVVQQNVLTNAQGLDITTVKDMYNQEYLKQAQAAGIILPNELQYLNTEITKDVGLKLILHLEELYKLFLMKE